MFVVYVFCVCLFYMCALQVCECVYMYVSVCTHVHFRCVYKCECVCIRVSVCFLVKLVN